MGFWDYLGIASVVFMDIYFIWCGITLLRGGEARVPGFTLLPERDKVHYDTAKVKKFSGAGYLVAAVGVPMFVFGYYTGQAAMSIVGMLLFFLGFGVPYQLLKRSDYFIKK